MPDPLPPALAALLEPMRGPTGPCDCHSCFAGRSAITATLRAVASEVGEVDYRIAQRLDYWADQIEKGDTP